MWLISYHGWFHRLTFLGNYMAIHFADRYLDRHLLNDSGIEWIAQFCWNDFKSSSRSRRLHWEMVRIRNGADLEYTWSASLHCRRGSRARGGRGCQHCECTKCHWTDQGQTVSFTLCEYHLNNKKKKNLTVPRLKPRCTISLSTL